MSQAGLTAAVMAVPFLFGAGAAPGAGGRGASVAGKGKDAAVRAAVLHYFKDQDAADWKAAYADLCADDRAALTADAYADKHKGLDSPLAKEDIKSATHVIKTIDVKGDVATVAVENTFLDEGALMDHAKAKGLDALSDDPGMKARADRAMLAEARSAHPPRRTRSGSVALRYEEGAWKVDEGWKKTMLLVPYNQKATDLWMAGKLPEARAAYEEILRLDPGNKNAKFMIQLIDERAAKKNAKP